MMQEMMQQLYNHEGRHAYLFSSKNSPSRTLLRENQESKVMKFYYVLSLGANVVVINHFKCVSFKVLAKTRLSLWSFVINNACVVNWQV